MRKHAAPIGLALLLLAIAASGCGSGAQITRAQAQTIASTDTIALPQSDPPAKATLLLDKAGGQRLAGESTAGATAGPAPTETAMPTETVVPTETTVPTETAAPTQTAAPTETPAPTATPAATATPVPTATARPTATAIPTATRLPTPTAAPVVAENQPLAAPDRLVAPSIGLDTKVVTVGWHQVQNTNGTTDLEWDVATYAAGWHKTSAPPGQIGNTVIAGHSDIEGKVFEHLSELKVGDPITIFAGGREFDYTVTDTFIVEEKNVPMEQRLQNARWIGPFPDDRLTLLTCWPPNNNTHRAFVIAKPVQGAGH